MNEVLVIVDLMLALAQRQAAFSSILRAMHADGRTKLNAAERKVVEDAYNESDQRLMQEIVKAKAEGR
jgi:hypothetical protein